MSRFIKADDLLNTLFEVHCKECDKRKGEKNGKYKTIYEVGEAPCKSCGVNDMREYLEDAPTADVVEVVQGEWIKTTIPEWCGTDELHRSIYRDREIVKCSECGNPSPVYNTEFEFCPHCGADMRGGKDAEL